MRRLILIISASLFFCHLFTGVQAQDRLLPTEPNAFLQQFNSRLTKAGMGDAAKKASAGISSIWDTPNIKDEDKEAFIKNVNTMIGKNYGLSRVITPYTQLFVDVMTGETFVKIDHAEFMDVSQQCFKNLEENRLRGYFLNLDSYLQKGFMFTRGKYHWRSFQEDPRLYFLTLEDQGKKYYAPIIQFKNTELNYTSDKDSTKIFNTSGDFNLISRTFLGVGGTITWEKMGLGGDSVYVELATYRTNFNYGNIWADSATLYYKGLLDRPLKGRFEDKNLGYRNINTANFPYFKSYDGNVVIENFVPNVRYEGGFSLRGIRKFGSSYDVWVDYVPPPSEEGSDDYYDDDAPVEETLQDIYDEFGMDEYAEDESYSDDYYDDYYDDEYTDTDDNTYEDSDSGDYADDEYYEDEGEYGLSGFSELPTQVQKHVPAKLEIKRGDEYVMKLQGEEFVLDPNKMVGKALQASIYLSDNDSLYHPSMDLLYSARTRDIILKKPRRGSLGRLPYTSSFHKFYMYFETIKWNLDSDEVHFTAFIDRENKLAAIESFDYFTKKRFDQMKGVLPFNPMGAIYRYSLKYPEETIFPEKILKEFNLMDKKTAFIRILPMLEGAGYIRFDHKTNEITPQPKLYNWTRAARGKKDYDAVQLTSQVDTGSHAVMRVDTKEMELRGVQFFALSDSQYIGVVPEDLKVRVRKDRGLSFGGVIAAGKINLYGNTTQSFSFDYESYRISCDSIDSMRFVLVRNPPKDYVMSPLEKALSNTVFEGVSGAVHIDAPNNKSGLKSKESFPVFDSYSSAYVYWEKPNIQDAIYKKDSLYFSLDPFVLDSLEDFDESNLLFDGEFYSSEIFPKFRQSLVVMEDFTLGFKEEAPANGYYIYDNKGLFYNEIIMDGAGLQGNGEIECLDIDVTVKSDSFIFHFDSVMATIRDFHRDRGFRSGNYYPEVDASEALYVWYTKEDRVALKSIDEPIKIFGGEADFEGELTIRPEGMIGDGALTLGQIKIEGDSIVFNEMDFSAPGADFIVIDELDPNEYHFVAEDVNVKYDVYGHTTSFETKAVNKSLAYFPLHQYRTSMAKGSYVRDENVLKLEGVSSYIKDNYFLSANPEQDSLKFNAKESYYNVDTRSILVSGVPYIYVADATITPDKLEVTIEENGLIKKLENAIVEADQETKLHRIYEADINIYSALDYEGSGKYDYIDVDGRQMYINFNNIQVNSDTTTIASGGISEDQDFFLTERIYFRGVSYLDASRKFLEFDGEVKIESENPAFKGTWFKFPRAVVNPDSVFIPIPKRITDAGGNLLTVGLNYVPESRYFYSNFLQRVKDEGDINIMSATGGLTFDRRTKEFRIGPEDKITGQSFKGATVSFNDSLNTITSQGLLDFPHDFKKGTVDMKVAGSWKDDLRLRKLSTDLMMCFNFPIIPPEPLEKVSDNLLYLTTTNLDVDFNQRALLENISELLDEGKQGDKETRKFIEEVKNSMVTSDIKLAKLLPYTFIISHINFNYSREFKALYSDSEVGLIGINEKSINKMVPAKIVYKFGTVGADGEKVPDRLDIYLEVDEFNWLFFSFQDEVISVTSSYPDDFNFPLQAEIDKRKKDDGFRFELISEDQVNEFRQDFVKKFIIR